MRWLGLKCSLWHEQDQIIFVNDKLSLTAIEAHQKFGKHEHWFLAYISQTLKMDCDFRDELPLVN
jgi:hypothetical protein